MTFDMKGDIFRSDGSKKVMIRSDCGVELVALLFFRSYIRSLSTVGNILVQDLNISHFQRHFTSLKLKMNTRWGKTNFIQAQSNAQSNAPTGKA